MNVTVFIVIRLRLILIEFIFSPVILKVDSTGTLELAQIFNVRLKSSMLHKEYNKTVKVIEVSKLKGIKNKTEK